jgi:hypothetical protein
VINWQETINTEKKLDVINWLKKGEQIGDICSNVWFTHSNVHTICDNFGRINESAHSETKVFVYQDYHSPIRMNCTKNYGCESLTFLLH